MFLELPEGDVMDRRFFLLGCYSFCHDPNNHNTPEEPTVG